MVIRTKTVFVVGAGASKELKFPLGSDLLSEIATDFDFKFNQWNLTAGNRHVWGAFANAASFSGQQPAVFAAAAFRVRNAAHLGLSIDNVIHQQNDDEIFAQCAKIGIAHRIITAEGRCALRYHAPNEERLTWPEVRATWLGGFAQTLVQDKPRNTIDNIFENVSVISFNYDRTVRRFLPLALASQYGIAEEHGEEIAKRLPIYHPYGSLGPLPYEGKPHPVGFGDSYASLEDIASNIRTFTEQIEDDDQLHAMRIALLSAERVVFLGFGYLAQNMELLTRNQRGSAKQVLGTILGLSESDEEVVTRQIARLFDAHSRSMNPPRTARLLAADFIQQNFRTLTS